MSLALEKVDGPECPSCGCADSRVLKLTVRWGEPSTKRSCCHCGRVWTEIAPVQPQAPKPKKTKAPSDQELVGQAVLRQIKRMLKEGNAP
jgi:hypothetical protein